MKLMSRLFAKRINRDQASKGSLAGALLVVTACLTTTAGAQATAPADASAMLSSDALNLRFHYPTALERRDAAAAVTDGHLAMLGLSSATAQVKGSVAACLRPVLLAETPEPSQGSRTTAKPSADGSETVVTVTPAAAATLLLAELDPNCLSGAEQVSGHKELPVMAQQFLATPGMAAVAEPASYSIGSQKVFMAAAQGHPETPAATGSDPTQRPSPTPFTIFTMAIATNWNNHLLVWLMSANQIALLDQISKSTVRFGRGAEAPLYPLTMGNATRAVKTQ